MIIALVLLVLSFGGSLATKCISMNNQPCMVRPTVIDLNPDKLFYYPFIISLGTVMRKEIVWSGHTSPIDVMFPPLLVPSPLRKAQI